MLTDAKHLDRKGAPTVVAIGKFDGVHRGHQALFERAHGRASEVGALPVVLTFHPHPAVVFGRTAPPLLTPIARKTTLIREVAPHTSVVAQRFDTAYASMSPREFAERVLRDTLAARAVIVGENFRFGKGRAGDFGTLRDLGAELGFEVTAESLLGDERGRFSSTRVRASLAEGALDDATAVLGRPYELEGVVVEGQKRGRTIGFPTANLDGIETQLPKLGVYAVRVETVNEAGGPGTPLADGVMNVGNRPTVKAGFSAEVHLFDLSRDLYGARLRVGLVARIRDERAFDSLDALVAQISADADLSRRILAASPSRPPRG